MNITVVGSGYVGLSLATLLSQKNSVITLDIDQIKIDKINNRISPINDKGIKEYFSTKKLSLIATNNSALAYSNPDYIIICTPTNFNVNTKEFNLSTVISVIKDALAHNISCPIIIKSTVPVGFTKKIQKEFLKEDIIFSPEFLREGTALYDNLNPSRIIVGSKSSIAKKFAELLVEVSSSKLKNIPIELMDSSEAEAVKLFSNTYLAMRIAFFNELDSYCEVEELNTEKIIRGIGHDTRIGNYYNNPSFGYGGYCLPKDTQQLLKNFEKIPNNLIRAIVETNTTRKDFIANQVLKKTTKCIGVYRLIMKDGSDNFRESATSGVIDRLRSKVNKIIIYEPNCNEDNFLGIELVKDLNEFIQRSDLILANRVSSDLTSSLNKVYTRDLFNEN
jgi:UDPglucose 6-dehydrogenase